MQIARLDEAQAGAKIAGRNINNHTELHIHIQLQHHFMANRETVKEVTDIIFLGSKITVDSNCSHKINRCFLLVRKAMTNLDRKQRHHFTDKGPYSQSYCFPSSHVQM